MLADLHARIVMLREKYWRGVQLSHDTKLDLPTLEEGCMHQIQVIEDKSSCAINTTSEEDNGVIYHRMLWMMAMMMQQVVTVAVWMMILL